MGRHYAINDSDITAPKPIARSNYSHQDVWTNIGDPWEPINICLANPTYLVDQAMITLCERTGEITQTL